MILNLSAYFGVCVIEYGHVYVCMYVCVCMYVYVCMYVHVSVRICATHLFPLRLDAGGPYVYILYMQEDHMDVCMPIRMPICMSHVIVWKTYMDWQVSAHQHTHTHTHTINWLIYIHV